MDEKKLQKILNKINGLSLSRDEKDEMRHRIHEYVDMNPVRGGASHEASIVDMFVQFVRVRYVAAAMVAFMVIAGSVAAENALPGDMLYPVKTGFNEEIMQSLAFSQESQAEVETALLKRRLEEIESLSADSSIDNNDYAELIKRVDYHAANADYHLGKLAAMKKESTEEIRAEMQASLEVHEDVLSHLSLNKSTTTRKHLAELIDTVRTVTDRPERANAPEMATLEAGADRGATSSDDTETQQPSVSSQPKKDGPAIPKKKVDERITATEKRVNATKEALERQEKYLAESEFDRLEDGLVSIDEHISSIKKKAEKQQYGRAYEDITLIQTQLAHIRELIAIAKRLEAEEIIDSVFEKNLIHQKLREADTQPAVDVTIQPEVKTDVSTTSATSSSPTNSSDFPATTTENTGDSPPQQQSPSTNTPTSTATSSATDDVDEGSSRNDTEHLRKRLEAASSMSLPRSEE